MASIINSFKEVMFWNPNKTPDLVNLNVVS